MFTGIVTHRGRIDALTDEQGPDGMISLAVRPEPVMTDVAVGDSVALDGVCLTVTRIDDGALSFDAVPETLRCTTLGARRVGDHVNLERALRMGDALGGHWVQGHVDGTGTIAAIENRGEDDRGRFSVYLIPHTLAVTGFGERRVGDALNVEADVLGRWVEHHLRRIHAETGA